MSDTQSAKKILIKGLLMQHPVEAARLLNTFNYDEILHYLKVHPVHIAKEVFRRLNPDVAAEVIKEMEDQYFVQLFEILDPYVGAQLLSRLEKEQIEKKLSILSQGRAKELKELMTYPPDSAGYLMDTAVTTFHPGDTVSDVLKRLRAIRDRRIVNLYIIDNEGTLVGLIPLQIVAVSQPEELLKVLVQPVTGSVQAMATREEVVNILEERKLINLPVVDLDNRLLGIIRYDALVQAAQQEATEDVQALFGAGREERALSKVSFAIRQRLPWLQINLATAFLAASVVGLFEETIAKITVLAVFLPVVAGQSGNTGSQALAVTIRGLALREIRISQWFRVARKEIAVGFLNGVAVALTTSIIVYFWADSFGLAVVIATSMVFSMVIAGFSGAVIPIMLKSLGQDPATSSSIILTTVTDVFGFLSFLGLATAMASMLGIS